MAAPTKLTDASVKQLKPASKTMIHWDAEVKGFGVRVTSGGRAFILNYRASGIQRQLTIGSFPDWSTGQARERAKELKRRVDVGEDPMGDRHAARTAPTMNALADLYREVHLPRKRSAAGDDHMLVKDILPRVGNKKVQDISHADIAALHREIAKRAPYVANRVLSLLSTMFSIAVKRGMRSDNPVKGVEKMPEEKRERYLSSDEIARLMSTLDKHPGANADAIRLLLLTGSRRVRC